MAAGFTVERDKLDDFRRFLAERFAAELAGEPLVATVSLDGVLAPAGAKRRVYDALAKLGPFGSGNNRPTRKITPRSYSRSTLMELKSQIRTITIANSNTGPISMWSPFCLMP